MKANRWLVVLVSVVALLGFGSISWAGMTDSLTSKGIDSLLGKQLGLTGDQSKGGIGAIMGLAKEKLSPADFGKIASAVPGTDKYISKAKSLGLLDKPLNNQAGRDGAFYYKDGRTMGFWRGTARARSKSPNRAGWD
jgi:hypothetical protein